MGARYDALVRRVAASRLIGWPLVWLVTRLDRCLLAVSAGRLSASSGSQIGRHMLLLICRGARSGRLRRVPLLFANDGNNVVLLASRAGTPRHPHWYYNLKAHPDCQATIAGQTRHYHAVEVCSQERERLWKLATRINPAYDAYAQQTARTIPVFLLRRKEAIANDC